MPLTIVASIRAQPGREDLVEAELRKLVEPTRIEAGCLQYDLHKNDEAPGHFLFYENWESRDLWQAHMGSAHIAAYAAATEGAVAEFILHEMERVA
ncbi:MAG: antibiotic biosynthesis monooxygenase [Gemmatimonadetes bacterium]|nr:antibiotic biosynthesis monooxygenase [Gemmatimonadota bacterium]